MLRATNAAARQLMLPSLFGHIFRPNEACAPWPSCAGQRGACVGNGSVHRRAQPCVDARQKGRSSRPHGVAAAPGTTTVAVKVYKAQAVNTEPHQAGLQSALRRTSSMYLHFIPRLLATFPTASAPHTRIAGCAPFCESFAWWPRWSGASRLPS